MTTRVIPLIVDTIGVCVGPVAFTSDGSLATPSSEAHNKGDRCDKYCRNQFGWEAN